MILAINSNYFPTDLQHLMFELCYGDSVFSVRYKLNFKYHLNELNGPFGISARRLGFDSGPVNVEFIVDKITMGQVSLGAYFYSHVFTIPKIIQSILS